MTLPVSKQAAIYVRVSTRAQREDGASLETQEEACRTTLAELGHDPAAARLYVEQHTGVELWERPALTELRAAIRTQEVDLLIVYDDDRLAREPAHLGVVLSEADFYGCEIVFVVSTTDNSPEGQLVRYVRGFASKQEWIRIRDRSYRGHRGRVAKGLPIVGCRPPYGYTWADEQRSRLVPDPVTSPVMVRIFESVAAGTSARKVAASLTAEGVPTPSGRCAVWSGNSITKLIREPVYIGRRDALRYETYTVQVPGVGRKKRIRDRDEPVTVPNVVPALVSEELAAAAVHQLAANKTYSTRNNRDPERTLLRGGIARCGYCGRALSLDTTNRGFDFYQCTGQRRYGCPYFAMGVAKLDGLVWGKVEEIVLNPDVVANEVARQREGDATTSDLAAIDRRTAELQRRQSNLIRRVADVDDDDVAAMFNKEIRDLAGQLRTLAGERESIVRVRDDRDAARAQLDALAAWSDRVRANLQTLTYDEKRLALTALGVQVKLWATDHAPRYEISMETDFVRTTASSSR